MYAVQRWARYWLIAGALLGGLVTLIAGDQFAYGASAIIGNCPCADNGTGNPNCQTGNSCAVSVPPCRGTCFPCNPPPPPGTQYTCSCVCQVLGGVSCGCR